MALISLFKGYPDYIGKRLAFCGSYTGPKSYATGGDPIQLPGFQNYIDNIENSGCLSVSGTYIIRAIPSAAGPRATWKVKWYTAAAPQTEVSAATDLSAESFVLSGLGGVY
jgi:hypothetical protein